MHIVGRRILIGASVLSVAGAAGAAVAREPAAADTIRLEADLSERRLYVRQGGEVIRRYAVAIGEPAHPTPRGRFAISKVIWNPNWVPPDEKWAEGKKPREAGDPKNPMRTVKMYFQEPDYYIHGTPHTSSLGKAASHGCLRMAPSESAELAHLVMQSGGQKHGWAWIKRVLRIGDTRTVWLKRSVPLTITG